LDTVDILWCHKYINHGNQDILYMKQLDLFENKPSRKHQRAVKEAKYKHQWTTTATGFLYPQKKLRSATIKCQCKQAVKVYYDFIEPAETGKVPRWNAFGRLTYDRFEQTRDMCYCPGCGCKLYVMNAKIKMIEVN